MIRSPRQTHLFAFLVCIQVPSTLMQDGKLQLQPSVVIPLTTCATSLCSLLMPSNSANTIIIEHRSDTTDLVSYQHLTSPVLLHRLQYAVSLIPLFPPLMDMCPLMATHDPGYAHRPVATLQPSELAALLGVLPALCDFPVLYLSPSRKFLLVQPYIWNQPLPVPHVYKAMCTHVVVFGTAYQVHACD
ncbi:hypothetical protein K439DRAFT_1663179 [Ramaria rubella]|nr:hypothetical protein K439DRAFT_1663179 [Ramaria rubella]